TGCRRPAPCGSRESSPKPWSRRSMEISTVRIGESPTGRRPESPHEPTRGDTLMPTEDEVRQALRGVLDPEIGKPIEDIGMLKGIEIDAGTVRVYVLLTIAGCPMRERIDADVTGAVAPLPGVERVEVILGEMSEQERQTLVSRLRGGAPGPQQQQF